MKDREYSGVGNLQGSKAGNNQDCKDKMVVIDMC